MLILPIKSKWFNMILSGDKQEEYREIKPYYTTRFKKIFEMYPNSNIPNPEQNTTRYTYTKSEKGKIVKCSRQYLRHIALMS